MRGKNSEEQLIFDPEIERTMRINNNKTRKAKFLVKKQDLKESSISKS